MISPKGERCGRVLQEEGQEMAVGKRWTFKFSTPQASHGALEKYLCVSVLHPNCVGRAQGRYDVVRCLDTRLMGD